MDPWIAWIEDFSTPEGEQSFRKLEDKLVYDPVLVLPDSEKEFEIYVDVKQGCAKGILVLHGGTWQPLAYFSKLLNPNCAATALMVTEARQLTRRGEKMCLLMGVQAW
uniref:Reverse transcriptase/retrotransposon-derived protein RNase H-like domain-containing protein n=1 Tax=Cyanoderma ruficeps TaxID=181631 RepID=A0A8C3QH96_9PASS